MSPAMIAPLGVHAYAVVCAAGSGRAALAEALRQQRSGLRPCTDPRWPQPTWIGRVDGLDGEPLPPAHAGWDCRATRLAWRALHDDGFAEHVARARERLGAGRIGLVLGTSASTIAETEAAYRALAPDGRFPEALRRPWLNTQHGVTAFVARALGLDGPAVTVSTACSSSARAFASAERWLRLGWVDAVVVGGVDALSASVLHGFRALGLLSREPCRPFSPRRSGISIGEAAGFALLSRAPDALLLTGYGESNDAYHMSSPHPEGLGAHDALDQALARAGIEAGAIDFVNLHGTASEKNDEVEAALLTRRYARDVHACATKGLTGHAMGAAGIVEAAISLLALEGQGLAGSAQVDAIDAAFGAVFASQLQRQPRAGRARVAASHSFGFGGNNAVLLFGREALR